MSTKRRLGSIKITGNWWDKHKNRPDGKVCKISAPAGVYDLKECAKICGSHYFDPDTMRFFKSFVGSYVYADGKGGAYFVTSEKGPNEIRAFSVRRYDPKKCNFDTVGEFQGYKNAATAKAAAKRAAGYAGSRTKR